MVSTILISSALVLEAGSQVDVVMNAILQARNGALGKVDLLPQALQLVSSRGRIPIQTPQCNAEQLPSAEQESLIFQK